MAPEQLTVNELAPSSPQVEIARGNKKTASRRSWWRAGLVLAGLAAAGSGGAYLLASGKVRVGRQSAAPLSAQSNAGGEAGLLTVKVVTPERGGDHRGLAARGEAPDSGLRLWTDGDRRGDGRGRCSQYPAPARAFARAACARRYIGGEPGR